MKQITQTLQVNRDGQLDESYYKALQRQARRQTAKHTTIKLLKGISLFCVAQARELTLPLRLDIADHTYGSHLRREYFAKKRNERVNQLRVSLGL